MTPGFLALVGIVVVGLVLYTLWDRGRGQQQAPQRTASQQMAELAGQAVQAAHDAFEVALDYSVTSVELVEGILAKLHEEHRTRAFFPERMIAEANRWGAYVGEVARRVRGGEWQRDSAHVGANTFPLVFGEQNEIYPCAWCYRRITNGAEDNVWVKFRLSVTEQPDKPVLEVRAGDL
jgi:hypothetical protein